MVQVSGVDGIISIDSRLDSRFVAVGAVRRAVACPVNCGGPSGGRGISKGLLGCVSVGRVLGKAGSRGAMTFEFLRLSGRACSVFGVVVSWVPVSILSAYWCFVLVSIIWKSYPSGLRGTRRVGWCCAGILCLVFGGIVGVSSSVSSFVGCGGVALSGVKVLAASALLLTVSERFANSKKTVSSSSWSVVGVVGGFVVDVTVAW